jgi:hypothetical protein
VSDTAVAVGIIGVAGTLAGTVAGALVSAFATGKIERRRERRADEERAAAFRGAARLVWLDVAMTDSDLDWAASRRQWHPDKVRMPMDAWDRYRDRLALGMNGREWEEVAVAMAALAKYRASAQAFWQDRRDLSPELVGRTVELRQLLIAAASTPRAHADLAPTPL